MDFIYIDFDGFKQSIKIINALKIIFIVIAVLFFVLIVVLLVG